MAGGRTDPAARPVRYAAPAPGRHTPPAVARPGPSPQTGHMCFSSDQRPPAPPKSSEIGEHGPVELTSADGTRFAAFDAQPVTRRGASLVLLPDIRGLDKYYPELA